MAAHRSLSLSLGTKHYRREGGRYCCTAPQLPARLPRQLLVARRVVACHASSSPRDQPARDAKSLLRILSYAGELPTQAETIVKGVEDDGQSVQLMVKEKSKDKDVDYLAELIAIQQNGPKAIGFFGTRNMGFLHQQLIEILSYAMVLTGNHIYTSGATGTNAAVIRGALRAEMPELLTVVLPQSLAKQPQESQELLAQVENIISMEQNDPLPLQEASRICNRDIVGRVQQVICFAFHDSSLMLETCQDARDAGKLVTLFYLD